MRPTPWIIATGLACTLAACGSDDSKESKDSAASTPTKVQIDIKDAGGGKFTLSAPKTVKAGLAEITLRTPPGKADHDAQFFRVEGNHSVAEVLKSIGDEGSPKPSWAFVAGGPGDTAGGATTTVTQELVPGKYYVLDTGSPDGDNAKSYAEEGATAEIQVTGEAGDTTLPATDAKITARDYSYETNGLKAGRNRLTFTNPGREIHHVVLFPFAKGATFAAVKKAFADDAEDKPLSGPPPVDLSRVTNLAAIGPGDSQVAELNLKPGKYAFVCFISDQAGGPPHVAKGMITEVTIGASS